MRDRKRQRQREKQAPCREPEVGLDPGSNHYKHKYPHLRDMSFTGLSIATLEEFKEMNKGLWKKLQQEFAPRGYLGGSAVGHLPLAQGVIPESWDRVPHQASYMLPALSLPMSLPLSVRVSNE